MLHHTTMSQGKSYIPFVITSQREVPLGHPDAGLYREIALLQQSAQCPNCGQWTSAVHEYHPKCVISGSYNGTPIYDSFVQRRFECNCGRTFMEPLSWLPPYQRMTCVLSGPCV